MKKNFTRNSLVRYLYKETSIPESIEITELLSVDGDLRSEFDMMAEMKEELESYVVKPSKESIDKILTFSHSHMIEA